MNFTDTTSWLSSFPFKTQLKSNYVPTDAETLLIKSLLVQPTKNLQKIESAMLRLKDQYQLLSSKHEELAHQLSACQSLITVPRRLPDDILLKIFHDSLPIGVNASLKRRSAPLVFTQVCSRWRQLAISTPTLWSNIHISLANINKPPRTPYAAAREESMLQEFHRTRAAAAMDWLKRSGSLTTLYVSLFGGLNPITSSLSSLYNKSVATSSSRWKSLFLQAPGPLFQDIATIPARDLKSLESLFLHFERPKGVSPSSIGSSPWITSELFMAPSLRKLSIRQDLFDPTDIRVNWPSLTHLEIGGPPDPRGPRHSPFLTLEKASSIFRLCARLVYCSIELGPAWIGVDDDSTIHTMHLPVLRRLSIGERIDIRPFVTRLILPVLEEFSFRSLIKSTQSFSCLAILINTGQTVRKLVIDCEFLSNQLFLESLQHCPSLVSLTVGQQGRSREYYERNEEPLNKHFKIDDSFLERLAADSTNSLCPRLEEFICGVDADFTLTGFFEFLWRKQMIGHTLGLSKLRNLAIECLPDPCNDNEFDLPEVSDLLQPYMGAMKFRNKSDRFGRLEPSELVGGNYGNSASQYADVWRD